MAVMAGDTRLSVEGERTSNPFTGALKVNILSPHLCVGFAGATERAQASIRHLGDVDLDDTPAVVGALLPATEQDEHGRAAQFLVMSFDGHDHSVVRVTGGLEDLSSGGRSWIGEGAAFSASKCTRRRPQRSQWAMGFPLDTRC